MTAASRSVPRPELPRAACRAAEGIDWFPNNPLPNTANARAAAVVCFPCPHRDECLEYALAVHAQGIWGGLTDSQRAALHAARQRVGLS